MVVHPGIWLSIGYVEKSSQYGSSMLIGRNSMSADAQPPADRGETLTEQKESSGKAATRIESVFVRMVSISILFSAVS